MFLKKMLNFFLTLLYCGIQVGPIHSEHHQHLQTFIGKPAPKFHTVAIFGDKFIQINSSYHAGKYLVLFFYPLDFTFVCPTEILAFSDRFMEFENLQTKIIACSVDSAYTHYAWVKTPRKDGGLGKINIPLMSDLNHNISKSYGVYSKELGHTYRGLFIIDPRGILRQISINDLPVGRSVEETLRLLQAIQHADKYGEVCPADWKPGDISITPDPEQKLLYFQAVNKVKKEL
ncbi:peroxiredoxin-2-like [Gordionus sp. m RMFG-2023]|uniref:peroxiredoxin-2-like n=1 Tax=Gordionus sp. m RMFG-2023 TaxID=3053472 RepID=UPI0031FDB2C3